MEWIIESTENIENINDSEISLYTCMHGDQYCPKHFCMIKFGGTNCQTRSCGLYIS